MSVLTVQIVRFVDEHFPGWVECVLVDALGEQHLFREKVPVVSTACLDATSDYPYPGGVRCLVEEGWQDDAGHSFVRVNTEQPDHVESAAGKTVFVVLPSQVGAPRAI